MAQIRLSNKVQDRSKLERSFHWLSRNWQSCFFLLVLSWVLTVVSYHAVNSGQRHEDFQTFYNAGFRLNHHQVLYDWKLWSQEDSLHFARFSYDYTPTVAILAQPFALFSVETAFTLWFISQSIFLMLSVLLFSLYFDYSVKNAVPIGICLLTGFYFWPTVCEFDVGQVNFCMLMLITSMLLFQKRKDYRKFAVAVGIMASIKYWGIALVAILVMQRKWNESCVAIFCFVAVTTLQFGLIGISEVNNFLIVSQKVVTQVNKALPSQSIFGFFRMLFSKTAFSNPLIFESDFTSQMCSFMTCAVLTVAVFMLVRKASRSQNESRLKVALVIQTGLLMLPACHIVYFIFSLPVLWTLLSVPASNHGSIRALAVAMLGAVMYTTAMHWPFPNEGVMILGFFYWSVALWVVTLLSLILEKKTVQLSSASSDAQSLQSR